MGNNNGGETTNQNQQYLDNFTDFLNTKKPGYKELADSDWFKSQPEAAQIALRDTYWKWAKKQPEFKHMDQAAYKDYIYNQSILDKQKYALEGGALSAVGSGGDLIGKIMQMTVDNPMANPGLAFGRIYDMISGGDWGARQRKEYLNAADTLREGAKIAQHKGAMNMNRIRPDTAIGEVGLKVEAGVVEGTLDLWKYMAANAAGPVVGFSALSMLEKYDNTKPIEGQWGDLLKSGTVGAMTGYVFEWAKPLKLVPKFFTMLGFGGVSSAGEHFLAGGNMKNLSLKDTVAHATTLALLSISGEGKEDFTTRVLQSKDAMAKMPGRVSTKLDGMSNRLKARIRSVGEKLKNGEEVAPEEMASIETDVKKEVFDDNETTADMAAVMDKQAENFVKEASPTDILDGPARKEEFASQLREEQGVPEPASVEATPPYEKDLMTTGEANETALTAQHAVQKAGIKPGDEGYEEAYARAYKLAKLAPDDADAVVEGLGIDNGWANSKAVEALGNLGIDATPERVLGLSDKFKSGEVSPGSMNLDVAFPLDAAGRADLRSVLQIEEGAPGAPKNALTRKLIQRALDGENITGVEADVLSNAIKRYRVNDAIPRALDQSSKVEGTLRQRQFQTLKNRIEDGGEVTDGAYNRFPQLRDIKADMDRWTRDATTAAEKKAATDMRKEATTLPDNNERLYTVVRVNKDGTMEPASQQVHTTVADALRQIKNSTTFGIKNGETYKVASIGRSKLNSTRTHDSIAFDEGNTGKSYYMRDAVNPDAMSHVLDYKPGKSGGWKKAKPVEQSTDPLFAGETENFTPLEDEKVDLPGTPPPDDAPPMSRQDVVDLASGVAGVTTRSDVETRERGQYGNRAVYLAQSGDIVALAHELGHSARKLLNIDLEKYRDELSVHTDENGVNAPLSEEFAEFSRLWITDRAEAKKAYPEFYRKWKSELYGHDVGITDFYSRVSDIYQKYLSQPDYQKFMAEIEFDPSKKEQAMFDLRTKFGLEFTNQFTHLQLLAKKYGLDHPQLDFLYKLLHATESREDAALKSLWGTSKHEHPIDVNGNIREDVTPFSYFIDKYYELKWQNYLGKRLTHNEEGKLFSSYLDALSMLHEGKDLNDADFKKTFAATRKQAEAMVAHVNQNPAKAAEFLADAEKLRGLFKFSLDNLVDSGFMSRKDADNLLKTGYKNHAILQRVNEGIGSRGVKGEVPDFFKTRHGSSSKIVGYMEVYRNLMPRMMRTAFLNKKTKAMVDFYNTIPEGAFIKLTDSKAVTTNEIGENTLQQVFDILNERGMEFDKNQIDEVLNTAKNEALSVFETQNKTGSRYVTYFKDGKPVTHQILDETTHEQVKRLRPEEYREVSAIYKALSGTGKGVASFMRSAFTKQPLFPPFNFARDVATRAITTQAKGLGGTSLLKAIHGMATGSDMYKQFLVDFSMDGFSSGVRYKVDKELANATGKTLAITRIPAKWLDVYGESFEYVNRFAEYLNGIEKYGNTEEGRVKATWDALDVTINFRMKGKSGGKINQYVPFFNAGVQELTKLKRALTDPKQVVPFIIKGLMTQTALEFLTHGLYKDKKWYNERSAFTRVMVTPIAHFGNHTIWLPKPFAIGALFSGLGELAAIPAFDHRKLRMDDITDIMKRSMPTILPNMGLPFLTAALELAENRNRYLGYDIEPRGTRKLAKRYRYSAYTPEFLVAMGPLLEKFSMSPAQADFLIQRFAGQYGRWAENTADATYELMTGKKITPPKGGGPVTTALRRFVSPDWSRTDYSTSKFIDLSQKLKTINDSISDKTVGELEKVRLGKKYKWVNNPAKRTAILSIADNARHDIYSLLSVRAFFINERSIERKKSAYYRNERARATFYFLKDNKMFSPHERDIIREAVDKGEQLKDQDLRERVLNEITIYTTDKAHSYLNRFRKMGVE